MADWADEEAKRLHDLVAYGDMDSKPPIGGWYAAMNGVLGADPEDEARMRARIADALRAAYERGRYKWRPVVSELPEVVDEDGRSAPVLVWIPEVREGLVRYVAHATVARYDHDVRVWESWNRKRVVPSDWMPMPEGP